MNATTTQDLNALDMAGLVALYKELTGKEIKKFDSKAKGIARIEKLLPAQETEAEAPAPEGEEVETEDKPARPRGGRTAEVIEMLRAKAYTTAELMEHFDTRYKNITGDLYIIRNRGEQYGLESDEKLVKESGAYSIVSSTYGK